MVVIKRYLDAGVQTLLIPTVQTEEEAKQAVAATRYPPAGVRGFASASRSSRFGRIKDYHTRAEEEICVLVQIETKLGLENLEAIARVEGVDGVFIGPGDLSAGLGYLGDQGHPEVHRVIEDAIGRIRTCGNIPGILTGDETLARRSIELGCLFTAVGSDTGLLTRGSEQLAARVKDPRRKRRGISVCRCSSRGLTPQAAGNAPKGIQGLRPVAISRVARRRPDGTAASAGAVGIIPVVSRGECEVASRQVAPHAHG
jgi:hypothetical protein